MTRPINDATKQPASDRDFLLILINSFAAAHRSGDAFLQQQVSQGINELAKRLPENWIPETPQT
jgi:hypothetical protein